MKALVVVIALVLAAPIARAQGMSDLELSAAYCLAYQKGVRGWAVQMRQSAQGGYSAAQRDLASTDAKTRADAHDWAARAGSMIEFWDKSISDTDSRIERYRSYLLSKGWLSPNKDPLPFLVAGKRGGEDFQECTRAMKSEDFSCGNKCTQQCQRGADVCMACLNQACPTPAACQRGQHCEAVSNQLPF